LSGFSPRQNNFTAAFSGPGDFGRWPGDFSVRAGSIINLRKFYHASQSFSQVEKYRQTKTLEQNCLNQFNRYSSELIIRFLFFFGKSFA
jgi:hypothetical protein